MRPSFSITYAITVACAVGLPRLAVALPGSPRPDAMQHYRHARFILFRGFAFTIFTGFILRCLVANFIFSAAFFRTVFFFFSPVLFGADLLPLTCAGLCTRGAV